MEQEQEQEEKEEETESASSSTSSAKTVDGNDINNFTSPRFAEFEALTSVGSSSSTDATMTFTHTKNRSVFSGVDRINHGYTHWHLIKAKTDAISR